MTWQFEQLTKLDGITEGPLWINGMLFFTHIAGNRIMQYRPDSGVGEVCGGTEASNGLMADRAGNIYACVGGGRRIARHHHERGLEDLCSELDGKRLNSPNDLAIDSQGRIWFTDPRYGDYRDDMELDHESVLRLTQGVDGAWACERMTFDTTSPNGILLSPDESILYVAESKYGEGQSRDLRAYSVLDDGSLGNVQILHNFYPHRGIDGMCLDSEGNIVATAGWEESGPGGMIYVFTPQGRVLETHPLPCNRPTNCAFGGADLNELFVTSSEGHLLHARTDRTGYLPYMA
ncbi:MAG: SMP-30/gluconolactonase/LRE family protein [Caldilineaceae bacterium]|nr:SMP-30/gluconolactonase/LRE family protein [Caldilineaceae bacterium]